MVGFINKRLQENILSVTGISFDNQINVYPNPVKRGDTLTLQLNSKISSEKIDAQVINYLGQIVLKTTLYNKNSNTITIETSNLKKGVYFLKTLDNQNSKTIKFVIQ